MADNAALLEIATAAVSATPNGDWRNRWFTRLETDHPGAALLEKLAQLEAVVAKVVAVGHDDDCMFCGFKDRIALDAAESEAK